MCVCVGSFPLRFSFLLLLCAGKKGKSSHSVSQINHSLNQRVLGREIDECKSTYIHIHGLIIDLEEKRGGLFGSIAEVEASKHKHKHKHKHRTENRLQIQIHWLVDRMAKKIINHIHLFIIKSSLFLSRFLRSLLLLLSP